MKRRKALNTIAVILVTLGLFLLIGTAGALENGHIGMGQGLAQIGASFGALIVGGYLFGKTYNPSDYNYEEPEYDVDNIDE